jgi:hypothetical protein
MYEEQDYQQRHGFDLSDLRSRYKYYLDVNKSAFTFTNDDAGWNQAKNVDRHRLLLEEYMQFP